MTAVLNEKQKEALNLFVSGAYKLDKLVSSLTEEQLDKSIAPGEWTIRQIIHHVAEDGEAWSMAIKKAIAIPGALVSFGEFPGNEPWANALAFDKRPIRAAIALLKSHRHVIAELAISFPDAWENCVTVTVPDNKEPDKVSIGQIIRMLGEHLAEHIATIEAIRKKHGIS
jgi:hypothetical protein